MLLSDLHALGYAWAERRVARCRSSCPSLRPELPPRVSEAVDVRDSGRWKGGGAAYSLGARCEPAERAQTCVSASPVSISYVSNSIKSLSSLEPRVACFVFDQ